MNRERRLPTIAEDTLEVLREPVEDTDDGLPKPVAKEVLIADDQFTDEEAEYAIDVLQNRGYIYQVETAEAKIKS